ncbi:MAG: hypothetical protein ILO34_07515 [Kiritimatiellae bacterium]|nr:hypothetical protein [Kiritimatiellia bacterium]
MSSEIADTKPRHSGGETATERLASAIGYPERIPAGARSFGFRVDGAEVLAEERDGRLTLRFDIAADASLLDALASYATGRMFKENATLAWEDGTKTGGGETRGGAVFLWQDVPANSGRRELLNFFETFMDSCDWWRVRTEELRGAGSEQPSGRETMMIRP